MGARALQGCWQPITFCTVCRACGPDRGASHNYVRLYAYALRDQPRTCVGGGGAVGHATRLLSRHYLSSERCLEAGRVLAW